MKVCLSAANYKEVGINFVVNRTEQLRTCIATRAKQPAQQLLRCVARPSDDGTVRILPDPRRRLDGRGAWVTPTVAAVEQAIERRAFQRAFRLKTTAIDHSGVLEYLERIERCKQARPLDS